MKKGIIHVLVLLLLFACNETKILPDQSNDQLYYPVEVGEFRIYNVKEITYRNINESDTINYQLREYISDSLKTGDRITYALTREIRENSLEEWQIDSVWSFAMNDQYLIITENNISFMKLTFPVKLGKSWNGNSFNNQFELTYYYQSLSAPLIDSIELDNHVQLIIEDQESIVGADLRSEVYVKGVGLVKKEYQTYTNCTTTSDCNSNELGEILNGRYLLQELVEISK